MPATRVIDPTRRFVRVTWSGEMTSAALRESAAALLSNPQTAAIGRSLSDIRTVQLRISGADLSATMVSTIDPLLHDRPWRLALLVQGDLQYGMCRQFLAYSEPKIAGAIFTDEAEAIAWLVSDA